MIKESRVILAPIEPMRAHGEEVFVDSDNGA